LNTGLLQTPASQGAHGSAIDSIRVESPLPGGVAETVRFLLSSVPSWVQIGGAILAAIAGLAVLVLVFRKRDRIAAWYQTRSTPIKVAVGVASVVLLAGAGTAGAVTWNYTQHSNEFCTGCHVMDSAVERMTAGTSKHSKLKCHDCHQQPISASAWQLYLWVLERPDRIEKHANVPNAVCENCHITEDTATWARIASTAGHRVHMESDSLPLKDIRCLDCHGTELHQFQSVKESCGQSACHKPSETDVVLGKMAEQTVRHCTSCHEFTTTVPALATVDSARGTLVPGESQCLGCHEMRKVLGDFRANLDPHGGKCGTCHNPHTQETPRAAANTCATSGCHSNWREEPFHSGENHRRVASQCLTCHLPHRAKVDASGCEQCHQAVRARGPRTPPLPFDTAAALRRTEVEPPPHRVGDIRTLARPVRLAYAAGPGKAESLRELLDPLPPLDLSHLAAGPPRAPPASQDGFTHARHVKLACLVCHETGTGRGRLTFERPRGCTICHHQAPARSNCGTCHRTGEINLPKTVTAVVTVAGHEARSRPVEFRHETHATRTCVECHTTPVSLALPPARATCRDCHDQHHVVNGSCAACHAPAQPQPAHKSLEAAHRRCDACHAPATVARLTPTRSFCVTCHVSRERGHFDARECTTCHFLAEPAAYRSELSRSRE
jgi:nitrate/TMAO reductase-like tetraheme cytochrome c subunit